MLVGAGAAPGRDGRGGDPDHARSRRRRRSRPPGRGDVWRPHRRDRAGRGDLPASAPSLHGRRCCRACRASTPATRGSIRSRASRRRRPTCRRAAPSIRDARSAAAAPRCQEEDPALRPSARLQRPRATLPRRWRRASQRRRGSAAVAGAGARGQRQPLLDVDDLQVHFPVRAGILRRTVGWVRAVDGVSLTRARRARRVSLVGRIRLRQDHDRPQPSWGSSRRPAATSSSTGRSIGGLGPGRLAQGAPADAVHLPGSVFVAEPDAKPVGEIVAEPLRIHGIYDEMGGAARIAELFDMVGLVAHDARALPARVLRRAETAHRHRARACASSRACSSSTSRSPRSTCRSRRRSSICCRTCSASSASPTCSSPTISRWSGTSRTASR